MAGQALKKSDNLLPIVTDWYWATPYSAPTLVGWVAWNCLRQAPGDPNTRRYLPDLNTHHSSVVEQGHPKVSKRDRSRVVPCQKKGVYHCSV